MKNKNIWRWLLLPLSLIVIPFAFIVGIFRGVKKIKKTDERCVICGCTDEHACEGGCYWVMPGLCSRCAEKLDSASEHCKIVGLSELVAKQSISGFYPDTDFCDFDAYSDSSDELGGGDLLTIQPDERIIANNIIDFPEDFDLIDDIDTSSEKADD